MRMEICSECCEGWVRGGEVSAAEDIEGARLNGPAFEPFSNADLNQTPHQTPLGTSFLTGFRGARRVEGHRTAHGTGTHPGTRCGTEVINSSSRPRNPLDRVFLCIYVRTLMF